jgi:outer membrane protein
MAPLGDLGEILNADTFKVSLGVSWSLLDARRIVNLQSARLSERSSQSVRRDATADVVTRTTVAYYDVLAAEEYVEIAQRSATSTKAHLAQTRAKREAGSATQADELRWQAQVAADRQSVVNARKLLARARLQLNNLLGRALEAQVRLVRPDEARLPSPTKAALSAAHPKLELAERSLEAKQLERRSARAAFLPTLEASAGYSWQAYLPYEDAVSDAGWRGSWTAGLNLTLPIFDSGGRIFELRHATRNLRKARIEAADTRRALRQRLAESNLEVRAGHENLGAARDQLRSAKAARDRATDLYAVGSATTTDLLDAQKTLAEARYNLSRARYSYLSALALRDQAAGTSR